MQVEPETKMKKIRLISGRPEIVDHQVNQMLDHYAISQVNFAVVANDVIVTIFLILQSEVRQAQIGNLALPPNGRR
jgi:hypothetical protein